MLGKQVQKEVEGTRELTGGTIFRTEFLSNPGKSAG